MYTYVYRNIEASSRNHCYRGKSVLHILRVCGALVTQHAKRIRHIISIVICGLSGSAVFFHIIS